MDRGDNIKKDKGKAVAESEPLPDPCCSSSQEYFSSRCHFSSFGALEVPRDIQDLVQYFASFRHSGFDAQDDDPHDIQDLVQYVSSFRHSEDPVRRACWKLIDDFVTIRVELLLLQDEMPPVLRARWELIENLMVGVGNWIRSNFTAYNSGRG